MKQSRRQFLHAAAMASATIAAGRFAGGCAASTRETVLYTSVDQPIAAKVIAEFERLHTGANVRVVNDTEASKSVGLATRLRAEKDHPVCHVWWGNEVFYTIGLADEGLFSPLKAPALDEIAPGFKDAQHHWAGSGLRARVLATNDGTGEISGSIQDLVNPRFKNRVALARPLAGSTGGHVAALYALWGNEKADAFFRQLQANNALMLGGNGAVAEQVASGNLAIGLTDNDDVFNVLNNGGRLRQVVPDQGADGIGTLAMPTTVAIVRRSDTSPDAQALAAFLLSDRCERLLIDEKFAAYSVRAGSPAKIKTMSVRYEDAAKFLISAPKRVADILDGRL